MISHSKLYSLSMAISHSDDWLEDIDSFLMAITEQKIADAALLWVDTEVLLEGALESSGSVKLLKSVPNHVETTLKQNAHVVMDLLSDNGFLADLKPSQWPLTIGDEQSIRYLLSLGSVGFLELILFKSYKKLLTFSAPISENDYQALSPVLDKFLYNLKKNTRIAFKKAQKEKRQQSKGSLGKHINNIDFQRRIIATLSHELRNPLNVILGYLDILRDTKLSKTQKEYVDIISDTGHGLIFTVKKVLQYANLILDHRVSETSSFNLIEMVNQIERRTESFAAKKRLSLSFDIDNQINNWLFGEVSKLSDILTYLIDNAIKFTTTGEILLSVKVVVDTQDTVQLQFEVSDTGKGIDEQHFERVFEFFGQEDDSITRHYGGLGLGLSLAIEFIRQMGGTFKVKSEVNKGTSIIIDLTFVKDLAKKEVIRDTSFEIDDELTKSIKILLVDDDPYQRDMGCKILKGWDLHTADNGLEAINFLTRNPDTEVVLMDIRMPVLDGISATRIIRTELNLKPLIIAVSGEVLETTIEECLKAGMDTFTSKPYDKSELIKSIINNLKRPELIRYQLNKTNTTQLSGLKALIVDDNKMIQLLTARQIKEVQGTSDSAKDGESALSLIHQNKYDFVLLDLYLPDMDGFQIAAEIQKIMPDLCLIAYSGDNSNETKKACIDAGFAGLILKNYVAPEDFAMMINHLISEYKNHHTIQPIRKIESYDLSDLKKIIGENPEDLKDILSSFINQSTILLEDLDRSFQHSDWQQLSAIAHSLKSSVRQFRMFETGKILENIERNSKQLSADEIGALLKEAGNNIITSLEKIRQDWF